ncbi:hypothetical protein [Mycobacterium sp. URHB0044]|uniref:hypothetical protein n=1 Tax=Mycobacterium sp. URHB0044 TaxID=1380386 RepID=UPI0012DEAA2C|nr:hypothetical protein [Mycobacterium sp. URHB0044]
MAIVAFGAGWFTNSQTIQAQKDQAVDQFRRDQRRDQYSTILQQATRLQNAGTFSTSAVAAGIASRLFQQLGVPGTAGPANPPGTNQAKPYAPTSYQYAPTTSRYNNPYYTTNPNGDSSAYAPYSGNSWQEAYTGLDQAISNAEIASSQNVINYARALRDRYRNDFYQSILANIDIVIASYPDPKPDRDKLAKALVGVPADTALPTYDVALLTKTTDQLTTMYVDAAKADLGLNDR